MMSTKRENNIFILGAGFSAPANIPLATNLWELILKESKKTQSRSGIEYTLYDNILKPDIDSFLDYKNNSKICTPVDSELNIELEEFISYLDMEDYLRLLGSDHWSSAGYSSHPHRYNT